MPRSAQESTSAGAAGSGLHATLFKGDTYFKQHQQVSAGEWFARAVEIDPNRETAFRYWGDSLSTEGKGAAAREKYIRAIIAEPYNRHSWLNPWAERTRVTLRGCVSRTRAASRCRIISTSTSCPIPARSRSRSYRGLPG